MNNNTQGDKELLRGVPELQPEGNESRNWQISGIKEGRGKEALAGLGMELQRESGGAGKAGDGAQIEIWAGLSLCPQQFWLN